MTKTPMTPPKNDAARKAWLRSLKDGDEVAWVTHYGDISIHRIRVCTDTLRIGLARFTKPTGKLSNFKVLAQRPLTEVRRLRTLAKYLRLHDNGDRL